MDYESILNMTNKDAAGILGALPRKTMTECAIQVALMKAIEALENTPDEKEREDISCDLLNKNRLWVSQKVYELIRNNPTGVIFDAVGQKPILVSWYPLDNPLARPESYLDTVEAIVDDMTMAQRKALLAYLKGSIEGNR